MTIPSWGRHCALLVLAIVSLLATACGGGTDGSDGPTADAGGVVDGDTWHTGLEHALARADAGSALADCGALFTSGPTHTNVMDLVIALVEPQH